MSFKDYVRRAHLTQNERGKFLRTAREDADMPDDFATAGDLVSYLRRRYPVGTTLIEGGRLAWLSYQTEGKRTRAPETQSSSR